MFLLVLSRRLCRTTIICLVICLVFFSLTVQAGTGGVPATRGVVKVSGLNVRKAPNKRSRRLFGLSRRTRVEVVEERGSWVKIQTGSGREGWAFRPLLKIIRPKKTLPDITLELNNISPEVGPYFSGLIPSLKKKLQSYFPQQLNLVISRRSDSGAEGHWLMVLEIPFSREAYQESKGQDVGQGTVDLLPYLRYLHGLLQYRDALLSYLEQHPHFGPAGDTPVIKGDISCYLNLVKDNRDILFLTGKLNGPFAVFDDHLLIKVEGYRPLKITALLPGCVQDFNKFILPEPYSYDGRRTTVAAVYDFFGFSY
jgi:hypothetical protein